jgi:hypothetical protein
VGELQVLIRHFIPEVQVVVAMSVLTREFSQPARNMKENREPFPPLPNRWAIDQPRFVEKSGSVMSACREALSLQLFIGLPQ